MSELARQLIENNLKTKAPVLDLGKCGLDGTEKELYYLLSRADHIETLIFSNDWHEYEEEKFPQQSKTSLNSGYNNALIQIPVALPKELKTLILAGDTNEEWKIQDFSFLKNLTQLQNLNLGYN